MTTHELPLNIITWGDLVPTLVRRYGLKISLEEKAYLKDFEHGFVMRLLDGIGSDSIELIGQDDFIRWTAPLANSALPIYALDDIHFTHLEAAPISVTRNFSSLQLTEVALRSRCHELEKWPLSGRRIDRPFSAPSLPIALLEDGVFSGGTLLRVLNILEDSRVTVERVYVVVAKRESLAKIAARYENRTAFWLLGRMFEAGWDHCRDLLGIHGLKVGESGFVPYWNIPQWISLEGVDKGALIDICKSSFEALEMFLSDVYGLVFKRKGLHLLPQRRCTKETPG